MNWKQICLKPEASILEAMKVIDDGRIQLALVVDDNERLLGTLTDGDIRRGFLKGLQPQNKVLDVMNNHPHTVHYSGDKGQIYKQMREWKISQIPVLDSEGRLVGLETLDEILEVEAKENHIVLMAGGLGSRLGALTNDCPKPMLKVGDKPILQTIIENFKDYGFQNFFLSVNYKSEIIEDFFGNGKKFDVSINYLKETKRLGTAGSLSLYTKNNGLPIVVMNADLLTKINVNKLLEEHTKGKNKVTMGVRQYEYQVPYGVIKTQGERVLKIEEKPVFSHFVSGGIYVFEPDVLNFIPQDSYFDMPTLIQELIGAGHKVGHYPIHEYWLDIGRKDDFDKAHDDFDGVFK